MTTPPPRDDPRGRRVSPFGVDGVLVELPDLATVRVLDERLRRAGIPGVVDVVPAARTVLVRGEPRARHAWGRAVADAARTVTTDDPPAGPSRTVEVPVVYDGADLAEVARLTGASVAEVVARHLAGGQDGYRVAFGGFMPGFAYVVGLDPRLQVPRLDSPRTRVPAGAVAVAGEFTAVYPAATPGGWRLLGRTDLSMFDVARGAQGAALLAPGDVVRFVRAAPAPVRGSAPAPAPTSPPGTPAEPAPSPPRARVDPAGTAPSSTTPTLAFTVVDPGLLTLVEDRGRAGLAAVGVPRSGAADPVALDRANRLVGNARGAAGLEVLLGGLVLTFHATTAVALVGADPGADLDGVPVPVGRPVRVPAGATLTLGVPGHGLRTWLAVRGGVDVPRVLGSRSRDVLSGLGPPPLRAGDVLAWGAELDGLPDAAGTPPGAAPGVPSGAATPSPPGTDVVELPALPGPRLDHLDDDGRDRLWRQEWDVTADSNRVAVRLDGRPLTRSGGGELASEGMVLGAVQLPHDGRPVLFGPDHPVTGGYPVVAVLTPAGVARAAQLRPGDRVRLTPPPDGGANHPPDGT
ncbi:urea amidolyase family protein [Cellulomonas phragmiteti]|uniref:Allophanate hydrolase n=1 Tax=Cellulomonas phragmiteti TaxID=478780 RepID=A0ABQ4DMD8_9CELL|nr:urea amidolyase family protein [Cellulomonas phragmiteti]GIG40519.1 allophanate hydrolase [Cellulomonas phragmiteti]